MRQEGGRGAVEWPTALLSLAVYTCWLAVTYFHEALPIWLLVPLGGWTVAWHSSLQHEIVHGHFTRWPWVNRAVAWPALALWLPFERYRTSHLQHHTDDLLTDPLDDPETRYWTAEDWQRAHPLVRLVVRAQAPLFGRMLIGPFWTIGWFLATEARAVLAGDRAAARAWAGHLVGVGLTLAWVVLVCGLPLWLYLVAFVHPGTALMLLRSFAEHRAAAEPGRRTAIVESASPFAWLYLFNNLHAAHHAMPGLPWYALRRFYDENREALVARNGGLLYRGYRDVAQRFLLRPHDALVHPLGRATRQPG